MKIALISPLALVGILLGSALAQQPPTNPHIPPAGGTPDQTPFFRPIGLPISLEKARQVVNAIEAEATRRNWKMNIAVVDPHGELLHFVRMDNAMLSSISIAQNKARTSARWRRESRLFYNVMETGHPFIATLDPALAASPGGFPLVEDGKIVGAVGCSGGTGDQDALVCQAGADFVK